MLGLGGSGKTPQHLPISAKPETQATPATTKAEPKPAPTKNEPTPTATKLQAVPGPVKVETVPTPKMEPTSVKMETMPTGDFNQIQHGTTIIHTTEKISPATKVPVSTHQKIKESETDLPKIKIEAGIAAASSPPVAEATVESTSPIAAEDNLAVVVPGTETKPTATSAPERVIREEQSHENIKLIEPTKSLYQIEVEPKTQETQLVLEAEPVIEAYSKKVDNKLVEIIIDDTPETQPVSTKSIIIKVRIGPLYENDYC